MTRRLAAVLGTPIVALLIVMGAASPAAAVTAEEKLAKLAEFTQISKASYDAWNAARLNQSAWAAYAFDWSTDYCSQSPDQPSGFDFRLPCYRHDFGYRNYKAMNRFEENKARLDSAFYEDLKRKCATYNSFVRPACYSLAWTYYQAVRAFGTPAVNRADLERAERLKAEGQARRAATMGGA